MMQRMHNIICLFFISSTLICMERSFLIENDLKDAQTVVYITDELAAAGSSKGCFLIRGLATNNKSIEYVHHTPTHNLISDKKNRIGIFCEEQFIVYDIEKKNRIWTQMISDTHYSAAFSKIDDTVFLCQNHYLTSNKDIYIQPLSQTDQKEASSISCHPTENKLLYVHAGNTIALRSLDNPLNPQEIFYIVNIPAHEYIIRAFYNPDATVIILETQNQKFYTYDPLTNTTDCAYACNICHNPLFIPHSKSIIAFICNARSLHYWHTKQQKNIKEIALYPYTKFCMQNPLINILDFSPSGTQIITAINGFQEKENHINRKPYIIFRYWALEQYAQQNSNYINRDILNLFGQYLSILFSFYID